MTGWTGIGVRSGKPYFLACRYRPLSGISVSAGTVARIGPIRQTGLLQNLGSQLRLDFSVS